MKSEKERPLSVLEGWTPVLVHWEQWWDDENHPPREVLRSCRTCYASRWPAPQMTQGRDGEVPLTPVVVSPQGVAHHAYRGDTTDCGRDCTGPEWWHRS